MKRALYFTRNAIPLQGYSGFTRCGRRKYPGRQNCGQAATEGVLCVRPLGGKVCELRYCCGDEDRWLTPNGVPGREIRLADPRLEIWDLMGWPQTSRTFLPGETPVYVVAENLPPEDFERALTAITATRPRRSLVAILTEIQAPKPLFQGD